MAAKIPIMYMEEYRAEYIGCAQDGRNWSMYFEFCKSDCQHLIDFTYAYEDLRNSGND